MAVDTVGVVGPLEPASLPPSPRPKRWGPRQEIGAFLLIPILVLVTVATATVLMSERIARSTALTEAERTAARVADVLVAPLLAGVLRGDPEQSAALDEALATRLSDGSITSVVVWSADGRIVFATDRDLVGGRLQPSDELREAIAGRTVSDIDEQPERAYSGAAAGPMVEVYVPLDIAGERLAVETYFSHDGIDRQAALLRGQILPLAIGALIVLQLVQVPIALSMSRRLRRHEAERVKLTRLALEASERERRAIAADVHDGPVQDLAGISYALAALRPAVAPERQDTVDRLVTAVRNALQSLRRLMTDIHPPDLSGSGLPMALQDLAVPLQQEGTEVQLDMHPPAEVPPEVAAAIYRTAKETLANVAKHAEAERVWICLEQVRYHGAPAVRLEVADDGHGFPADGIDRRSEGHVGLRVLQDRIIDLGGTVELGNRLHGGAVVIAVLPLDQGE